MTELEFKEFAIEVYNFEAKTTLLGGLGDFVEYFSDEHFKREQHPKLFQSRMRVRAMVAEKLVSLIEDGKIVVNALSDDGVPDYQAVLKVGHAIHYQTERMIAVAGVPMSIISRPYFMRDTLVNSDFIPMMVSHYRKLRSVGAPLVSEYRWRALERGSVKV